VVRHLLGRCAACAERIRQAFAEPDEAGYDEAIARAMATAGARGQAAGAGADEPWRRRAACWYEAARQRFAARVAHLAELDPDARCRALLAAARELRHGDPRLGGLVCRLGLATSETAETERADRPPSRAPLRASAAASAEVPKQMREPPSPGRSEVLGR